MVTVTATPGSPALPSTNAQNQRLSSFLWLWRPAAACCSGVPPRVPPEPEADCLLSEEGERLPEPDEPEPEEEPDEPDEPEPDWRLEPLLSSFLWL
jgi:hypothetical protein